MKAKLLVISLIFSALILAGCGKKDAPKTDTKSPTTSGKDTTKSSGSDNKSAGDKKLTKSTEKKDMTKPAPADWTKLQMKDGKVRFHLPSAWNVKENSEIRFVAMDNDETMGTTAVIFNDETITADDLLAKALADFDFDPEGQAFPFEENGIQGDFTTARGKINGTDMMMYIMSAIDTNGKGNYVVYVYTPTTMFEKNQATMDRILTSVEVGSQTK
jgi:hypothetical protein